MAELDAVGLNYTILAKPASICMPTSSSILRGRTWEVNEGNDTDYLRVGQAAVRLGTTIRTPSYWVAIDLAHASTHSLTEYPR